MATSGTTAFNPDNGTILEEAFELAGVELRTGNDFESAIRSLDLLKLEWGNEGLNLWTVEEETIAVAAADNEYSLPVDTIDLLHASIRTGTGTSQQDTRLRRVGFPRWSALTNKNQVGMPTTILVERTLTPSVRLWPVPDRAYTLVYWRLRRIEDAGGVTSTLDMPTRFIPAITTGLAIKIAIKRDKLAKADYLRPIYMEQMANAKEEDRDRSSFFVRPHIG
jgi:hypothetical protein